jgi:polysaccharide export outer membrane protein
MDFVHAARMTQLFLAIGNSQVLTLPREWLVNAAEQNLGGGLTVHPFVSVTIAAGSPQNGGPKVRRRPKLLALFMLLAGCMLLTDCAAGRNLPPLPPLAGHEYRLGPGDTLRIITYGEDPLTGEFRVGDQGSVALPLAGTVRAAGSTPRELEDAIASALKKADMLRKPSVSVEVATYRPIYVLGEVNKPGQYPYQPGMTVVSAAAVAGGFTYRAVEDYASVVRVLGGDSVEGKASRQALVQPGDVITVFERKF